MDFNNLKRMPTELFPDYFEPNIMVTAKYKQTMNLRIINKLHYLLREMKVKERYLENYWYNLKYMVKALHGVYLLLYKILKTYGNAAMCSKSDYHNLIYGSRPVKKTWKYSRSCVNLFDSAGSCCVSTEIFIVHEISQHFDQAVV